MSHEKFQNCIRECDSCAAACSHCATECLREDQVKDLAKCIQLDVECAAICRSAAEIMSLGSYYSHQICQICADACNACAEECEKHAKMGMRHCRECAEACRQCAAACKGVYFKVCQGPPFPPPAGGGNGESFKSPTAPGL